MAINILMPALSPTMTEGKLARWLKHEGDEVKSGDVLAEIETDKATMEVEAVDEGYLAKIVVPDGTEGVAVNAVIGILTATKGEAVEAPSAAAPAPAAAAPAPAAVPVAAAPVVVEHGERVFASPLARRIAKQAGIDLATVKGSGPGGRIVKADLEGAPAHAPAASPAPVAAPTPVAAPKPAAPAPVITAPHQKIPNSTMRKVIARRLTESKQTVPHFYLTVNVELDKLLALRAELNAKSPKEGPGAFKLSVNDLIIKACGVALKRHPGVNASWTDEAIIQYDDVDISVAVATPNGLITPIVKRRRPAWPRRHLQHDEGTRRAGQGGQAEAGRIPGRRLLHLQPRHVRHLRVLGHHQPAAGRHSGRGCWRKAPGGERRCACHRHGDECDFVG